MTTIPQLEVQTIDGSYSLRADGGYRFAVALAAGVESRITVPTDTSSSHRANYAFFAAEATFFAAYTPAGSADVTAAIPAADITDGTAPDLNPTVRVVRAISEIGLISRVDQVVTIAFYL